MKITRMTQYTIDHIKRSVLRSFGLGALLMLLASCVTSDRNSTTACSPVNIQLTGAKDKQYVNKVSGHIDDAMQTLMTSVGAGSCSVVMVAGNKMKTINGYGDPRASGSNHSIPSTWASSTPYYIGSIAKTVTALAMMKMIEQSNDITLDDAISEHLSDYAIPSEWQNVTIRQLLAHTSGIAKDPTSILDEATLIALFPSAGAHPGIHPRYAVESYLNSSPLALSFAQNFNARYSNIGYSLLGLIIDDRATRGQAPDASGYEQFVFQNIALNAGAVSGPAMLSMCLGTQWRADNIANLAQAKDVNGNDIGVFPGNGWEGPSGGWTMTVGDLGRMMLFIQNNLRLNTSTTNQLLSPFGRDRGTQMVSEAGNFNESANYALGVAVEPSGAEPYFAKGGDITGYTSNFKFYTEKNVGAGILCSRDSVSHIAIVDAIHEILAPCISAGANPPSFCSSLGELGDGN